MSWTDSFIEWGPLCVEDFRRGRSLYVLDGVKLIEDDKRVRIAPDFEAFLQAVVACPQCGGTNECEHDWAGHHEDYRGGDCEGGCPADHVEMDLFGEIWADPTVCERACVTHNLSRRAAQIPEVCEYWCWMAAAEQLDFDDDIGECVFVWQPRMSAILAALETT